MYIRLPRPSWGLLIVSVLAVGGLGEAATTPSSDPSGHNPPGPLVLEELEPFVPKQRKTEDEADRLEALAMFSAGRMHEQRQQYAAALRFYQRALRRDPAAVSVARAIVPLAFRLKRHAEAVRYALLAIELEDSDPLLLRRLAAYLIEAQDFQGALKLYEKAAAHSVADGSAEVVQLWMDTGRLCHVAEKHDKAADYFARVRDALDDPRKFALDDRQKKRLLGNPAETYNLFGESFLQAGRTDQAAAAFNKAHQLEANEALLKYNLARVHAHNGRSEKALAALQISLRRGLADEGVAPYELLADMLDDLGRKDELVGRLEKLRADEPENVPLGYFLAERYLEAERLEKAEQLYVELIRENPTLTGYRRLVEIRRKTDRPGKLLETLGEVVTKMGTLETLGPEAKTISGQRGLMRDLVAAAREKHEDSPKELRYGMHLAVALLALEARQFETATEFFESAIQARPHQTVALRLVWGLGLLFAERPAEAAEVFQLTIDELKFDEKRLEKEGGIIYYYLAGALAMDSRTDEALAAASQSVAKIDAARRKAAVEEIFAQKNRAAMQRRLENLSVNGATEAEKASALEEAVRAVRKATLEAIVTNRKHAEKQVDLARFRSRGPWVLYHAKRYDEAIKAYLGLIHEYENGSGRDSNAIRQVLREARLVLSSLYVLKDDLTQAEEWLEQVLDEFPDDVGASNDLGYLWADQGKHVQRSLKMIRHAVEAQPDNVAYRDSLGWVFYRLGRFQEAVAELEKAASDGNPDAVILEHLGDAYSEAGRPEKAKNAWNRAVEAFKQQGEPENAKRVEGKVNRS